MNRRRVVGEPAADRLGHAEVDDLGYRLAVDGGDEDVRRFQVAMNDARLVRVLHRSAGGGEQPQPLPDDEPRPVDELHEVERPAVGRHAAVEHLGDVRAVYQDWTSAIPLFRAGSGRRTTTLPFAREGREVR
jgi:hypothetical protein